MLYRCHLVIVGWTGNEAAPS